MLVVIYDTLRKPAGTSHTPPCRIKRGMPKGMRKVRAPRRPWLSPGLLCFAVLGLLAFAWLPYSNNAENGRLRQQQFAWEQSNQDIQQEKQQAVQQEQLQDTQQDTQQEQSENSCPPIAELLLKHWRNKIVWTPGQFANFTSNSTASVLKGLGLAVPHDYCYCLMRFDGSAVLPVDTFEQHCQSSSGKAALARAQIHAQLFNRLFSSRNAKSFAPFEFYIDSTDGTRNNPELFKRLGVPVLSVARSPDDQYTLPLPDHHMLSGLYSDYLDYDVLPDSQLHKYAGPNLLAPIYRDRGWPTKWSSKIPTMVYRGSCFPTMASNETNPHARVMLRPQICAKHAGKPLFDIGLNANVAPCNEHSGPGLQYCEDCRVCKREALHPRVQSRYRYQIIADGMGGSTDATMFKLLSNSVVVRLRPDGWDAPLYELFFDALLKPGVHFIPSNVSGLPEVVSYCEGKPRECKSLGREARRLMKCLLNREVIEEYMFGVFVYMHKSVYMRQMQQPNRNDSDS